MGLAVSVANFVQSGATKVSKNGFPFLLALILDSPILGLDFCAIDRSLQRAKRVRPMMLLSLGDSLSCIGHSY